MGTMAKIAVLPQDSNELRIEGVELPDPGPHQVVVKQFASGICHSQLHEIHNPRKNPVVLGHESTGVILQTGSAVTHVAEGDIVIVTWVLRDAQARVAFRGASRFRLAMALRSPRKFLRGRIIPWSTNNSLSRLPPIRIAMSRRSSVVLS